MSEFGGFGWSVLAMGEWSVGQWVVGAMNYKNMYGFHSQSNS